MEYLATYTILIDDATWGREDYCFDADSDIEAVQLASDYEEGYVEIRNGRVKELMLDSLEDENGNEIDYYKIKEDLKNAENRR